MKCIFICILLLALSACSTVGTKVSGAQLSEFQNGKTTEAQVIAALGKPDSVTINSEGTKTLVYTFFSTQVKAASFIPLVGMFAGGTDTQSSVAMVYIKDGVVTGYTTSEGALSAKLNQ
jgi:outer membrane protein assembly factor BamE (lipoprotein component of BamABCDE complex)